MNQKAKSFFVVLNDNGLHTRPSTELVKCAANYNSSILLSYHDYIVDAKSILGILMLAAERGAKIGIEAIGSDAHEAVSALLALAKNRFNLSH